MFSSICILIRRSVLVGAFLSAIAMMGCGAGSVGSPGSGTGTARGGLLKTTGSVHGGQQPISGATISLYAAGKTGAAATVRSMLTGVVTSMTDGSFDISGLYSCQAGDQVYLVASGGDAGSGGNSAIKLMAAMGPCSALLAGAGTIFINVDEVTTVGSVYALQAYMTGATTLGADYSSTANSDALAGAFADVNSLVDTTSGQALMTSVGNGVVPQTTINSLANSLAACVNSASSTSNNCVNLFTDTTVPGSTPTDTLQAALNLAHYPTTNAAAVYALGTANPPFQPSGSAPASYAIAVAHPSDVLMYHNDAARDGVQSYEQTLTPANVNSTQFGKKYSFAVDSYMFAQPLYAGGVGMPDGAVHNVLVAATTHATVYGFDADGNNPSAGYLWSVSLIPTGERYPTGNDYGCNNPPEAGIVGTPVIDRAAKTIYLVTKTITTTGSKFTQRLHAISLLDGTERPGSPTVINPTFAGTGDGSSGGSIPFDAKSESNRSALLLAPNASGGNTIWVAYASHCDIAPYHGDVLGFDGSTLAPTATFNNTPNGNDGGIWMGAGGLAADAQGYIYGLSGNGTFDANAGGPDYGDGALKLTPPASGAGTAMTVKDYFTPSNQATLQQKDLDLGGAEGVLFTDAASGVAPHLLVANDKNGYVYLLNTDNMGAYDTGTHGPDSLNGDVQDFSAGGVIIYNFSFFNNTLYTSTPLKAYAFTPGTSTTAGSFNTTPVGQPGVGPTAPVVSANGTANAVVWAQDTGGVVHAYTAPNLTEIYASNQAASGRDTPATFVKFNSPVVANGKVYVGGQGAVTVYGLLP